MDMEEEGETIKCEGKGSTPQLRLSGRQLLEGIQIFLSLFGCEFIICFTVKVEKLKLKTGNNHTPPGVF